ncbi:MAG: O-antigen ligase family protein [Gaiella sp.]
MTLLAQVGSVVGALGLAALLLCTVRWQRLAGLVAWGVGVGAVDLSLLPDLSVAKLVAAGVGGLAVAVAGAAVLVRWPYALAFASLACVPARVPVDLGDEQANLLIPLYGVVVAFALSLGWKLLNGDHRSRELGRLALPLAAVVVWNGLALTWSSDVNKGSIFMAAFVLPFGLLAVGFARLPWRGRWLAWLWAAVVGTALAYAAVGGYQWITRDVFWNPSVIVFNAYAPFFRVNSIFWDPSVYGRYLAVALLATLAGILLGGIRGKRLMVLYAVVVATWLGLYISFSQSSYAALAVGIVVAAAVTWGRRALIGLPVLALVAVGLLVAVPSVRHELVDKSKSGVTKVTGGRYPLINRGLDIWGDAPVWGAGAGAFGREYAARTGAQGRDPKRVQSHTTPITVAAETGVVGLALWLWLLGVALWTTLRGLGTGFTSRVSLAVGVLLSAIAVHSLFYASFFEDPMTWALFGLVGLAARVPKKPAPRPDYARAVDGEGQETSP